MDRSLRSDSEVIAAVLSGDGDAFAAIVERHSAPVRALVAGFFPNRHQVDDITQETFVNAFFHLKSYRGEAPLEFWLKKIAVRLCYRELKRAARTEPLEIPDGAEAGPAPLDTMLAGKVEDEAARIEQRLLVEKLLARLGAAERLILQLSLIEGRTIKEIAELTGWTQANVKVRGFRARRALKKEYLAAAQRRESGREKR